MAAVQDQTEAATYIAEAGATLEGVDGAYRLGKMDTGKEAIHLTVQAEEAPQPSDCRSVCMPTKSTAYLARPRSVLGRRGDLPLCEKRFEPTMPHEECDQLVRYRVNVENLRLSSVVEVEARLWYINSGPPDTRHRITTDVDHLMELSGKWHEARRTPTELSWDLGDRFFSFRLPDDGLDQVTPEMLADNDRYLFQVWSKHGFTNFGKVHKLRVECVNGDFKYLDAGEESQPSFVAAITTLTKREWRARHDRKADKASDKQTTNSRKTTGAAG